MNGSLKGGPRALRVAREVLFFLAGYNIGTKVKVEAYVTYCSQTTLFFSRLGGKN